MVVNAGWFCHKCRQDLLQIKNIENSMGRETKSFNRNYKETTDNNQKEILETNNKKRRLGEFNTHKVQLWQDKL